MKDNFEMNDNELELVSGGAGDVNGFGWNWGDDWGDSSYFDDMGATGE